MIKYFIYTCSFIFFSLHLPPHTSRTGHTTKGLVGHFTFEKGAQDALGNFGATELHGVTIDNGCLQLERATWAQAPYHGPACKDMSFISFVRLKDLDLKGGSVATFMRSDGEYFNGLALGEIPWKFNAHNTYWVAVSEFKNRTKNLRPGYREESTHQLLKMAITFKNINGQCQTTIYRNGEQIGQYIQGNWRHYCPIIPRYYLACVSFMIKKEYIHRVLMYGYRQILKKCRSMTGHCRRQRFRRWIL